MSSIAVKLKLCRFGGATKRLVNALIVVATALAMLAGCGGKEKVAIVGAGAAGLTTAYLLKKEGYDNITIFEAEEAVGGVARTEYVDGQYYDMATMFVPGGSILGDGIQPLLKEMIDYSEMQLIPAVGFDNLPTGSSEVDILNELIRDYQPQDLANQLITGLVYMTQMASCFSQGISAVDCGIVDANNPDELLHEWGARNNVLAFAHLITYTNDALGAGPTGFMTVARGLLSGANWTPVEVVRILKHLGVNANDLPENTPPNIVSLMAANDGQGSQRWWFFERGYQNFWIALTNKLGVKVKYSEPVVGLEYVEEQDGGYWVVTSNKSDYEFDKVIVATMPRHAIQFLPTSEQKDLIADAIVRTPPNDVFITRIADYEQTGLPAQLAWWNDDQGLGVTSLIDPNFGTGVIKPFFWQKRHENDYMVAATYMLSDAITPAQNFAALQASAAAQPGFAVVDYVAHERFYFPAAPADPVTWAVRWAELQGENELYFVGEAFNGSGVPAIASSLSRFIPQYFGSSEE